MTQGQPRGMSTAHMYGLLLSSLERDILILEFIDKNPQPLDRISKVISHSVSSALKLLRELERINLIEEKEPRIWQITRTGEVWLQETEKMLDY